MNNNTQDIFSFFRNNNEQEVKDFIFNYDKNTIINLKNDNGHSLLFYASSKGYLDIVKYLINNGADVNSMGGRGIFSLYTASSKGHLDIVKYLIDNGADVNLTTNIGLSSLYHSICNGHLDIVKYLIDNGANFNFTKRHDKFSLYSAANSGHLDIIKFLIDNDITLIYKLINMIIETYNYDEDDIKINFLINDIHHLIGKLKKSRFSFDILQDLMKLNENPQKIINILTKKYGIEPSIFNNFYRCTEINDIKRLIQDKKQSLDDTLKEHNIPKDLTKEINKFLYY